MANGKKPDADFGAGETTSGKAMLAEYSKSDEYSLEPKDEVNGVRLTEQEKQFILLWIEFRSLPVISVMMGISEVDAAALLGERQVRSEIDRISEARMMIRFSQRMLTIDECESYLTSCITDDGVPVAERLTSKDKLSAMKLLLELKEMKAQGFVNPTVIDNVPIEMQLKDLSIDTVKALIASKVSGPKKEADNTALKQTLISVIPNGSVKEASDISHMSPDEILKILDNMESQKKKDGSDGK